LEATVEPTAKQQTRILSPQLLDLLDTVFPPPHRRPVPETEQDCINEAWLLRQSLVRRLDKLDRDRERLIKMLEQLDYTFSGNIVTGGTP
jgi:hypothetical protein